MLILKVSNAEAQALGVSSANELKERLMSKPVAAPAVEPAQPEAAKPAEQSAPVAEAPKPEAAAPAEAEAKAETQSIDVGALVARIAQLEAKVAEQPAAIKAAKTDAVIEACAAQGVPPVAAEPAKAKATKDELWAEYNLLRKTDSLKATEFYREHRAELSPF